MVGIHLAILMHGFSFTLIGIPLQLEVHRVAPDCYRATAQGLLVIATQGIGAMAGARLAGLAEQRLISGGEADAASIRAFAGNWPQFWMLPALGALAALIAAYWLGRDIERFERHANVTPETNATPAPFDRGGTALQGGEAE